MAAATPDRGDNPKQGDQIANEVSTDVLPALKT